MKMKTGKYLVSILGMFPRTILTDTLEHVRETIGEYERDQYRVFKVNGDGYIQRCDLSGKVK